MLLRHTEIIAVISTHAPAGGATLIIGSVDTEVVTFLLTPLREGRPEQRRGLLLAQAFLLTPLREWRPLFRGGLRRPPAISTHAPAGGATSKRRKVSRTCQFLLTPLREGRLFCPSSGNRASRYPHFPPRPAHWSAVQPDAGRTLRETVGKEESAPTHPWQNQSSSAGSASQTTGSKALGLNPICTPLGTLSRETSAS